DAIEDAPIVSFDWVGDQIVSLSKSLAPVGETGKLRRGIKKVKPSRRTVEVVSEAPYSAPVDQGHKTRQGTGKAPGYKPKPGGKTYVQPNPYFSSVVGRIGGNDLIRRVNEDINKMISLKVSKYKSRGLQE
ncbi:MAG TPA: hypothetical protein VGE97_02445, partial [Nitrososphaera sp.]